MISLYLARSLEVNLGASVAKWRKISMSCSLLSSGERMWKTMEQRFELLLADGVFSNAFAKACSVKDGTAVSTLRPIASSALSTVFGLGSLDPFALELGAPFGDPSSVTRSSVRLVEDVIGVPFIVVCEVLGE